MPERERITVLDEERRIHFKAGDDEARNLYPYAKKCEEYLRFGYEVDEVTSGNYHPENALKICETPQILLEAGFEQKPLLYTQKHILDAILPKDENNPHCHGLTIEQIKKLPYLIENPVMISNSPARKDAAILVLNEVDKDKLPIIAAIKPDAMGNYELKRIETNLILSVYGKDNFSRYFEERITPEKVVYINKEKSQRLEALAELQLFRGHSKLDFDTIIQKPECVVNMEKEKYVRIVDVPKISFNEWVEMFGYDKNKFPSEAESYAAYQSEVKSGKIPIIRKKVPLDLSGDKDRTYCRMQVKRLEKEGKEQEAADWRNFYDKNYKKVSQEKSKNKNI